MRTVLVPALAVVAAAFLTSACDHQGSIPQPSLGTLNERTRARLAPDSRRVDLDVPTFSNPTKIANPLFPVSDLRSVVLVGRLEGRPWRAETTLLPETKTIDWNGKRVETLESQFVAYLDERIFEVAVDHYAQADDGAVWYFGEDAYTYEHGRVADREGTWLAGPDRPPAMIMPARPRAGDVYRTENIPGLVFEQVTVKSIGKTVEGPSGPVEGAMVGQELHMDEAALEEKTFAPGYGEWFSGSGGTFEANAVTVPADARPGPEPPALRALAGRANELFDSVAARSWIAASRTVDKLDALRARGVPARLESRLAEALGAARASVRKRNPRPASLAALAVAQVALDLQLQYRPPEQVDQARLRLWRRQLRTDAAAGDAAAAAGDVATLRWIRRRLPRPPAR